MKFILLVSSSLMFSLNTKAVEYTTEEYINMCKTQAQESIGDGAYSASTGQKQCIDVARAKIQTLIRNGQLADSEFSWTTSLAITKCKSFCEKLSEVTKGTVADAKDATVSNANIEKVKSDLKQCLNDNMGIAIRCTSVAYILDAYGRDWNNPDHISSANGNTQQQNGNIQGQQPTNQNNGQAAVNANSSDALKCKSMGIETVDYEPCKSFSDYAQGLDLAHQAVNVGQNLYYQNKALDNGLEAAKNSANDATAGLKAQKNSFKDQQEYYTQNSAIEASKAAFLLSKYQSMPTAEEVADKCNNVENVMTNIKNELGKLGKTDPLDFKGKCRALVVTEGGRFALLMNQSTKDAMKAKLVKLGINAIAEGTKAYMAGKRADQVSDAIAQVDSFQPVTTPGLEEAVETTFCQMNPTAVKCQTAGLGSSFSTIGDNIVDFGNNGTGTVYSGTSDTDGSGSGGGNSAGSTSTNKTGVIGSAITGVNKGSGLESTAAAATIGKGNGPSGGGGGGGGGGGSLGGGGGAAAPAAQQAAGAQSAIASKSSGKYSGGAGVSVIGGLGIKGAKKTADNSNPFGNMFDKKAGADKVLNFRGPASDKMGGKGDNLFDMISKRYGSVNNDKRLIEYEEVTK